MAWRSILRKWRDSGARDGYVAVGTATAAFFGAGNLAVTAADTYDNPFLWPCIVPAKVVVCVAKGIALGAVWPITAAAFTAAWRHEGDDRRCRRHRLYAFFIPVASAYDPKERCRLIEVTKNAYRTAFGLRP